MGHDSLDWKLDSKTKEQIGSNRIHKQDNTNNSHPDIKKGFRNLNDV